MMIKSLLRPLASLTLVSVSLTACALHSTSESTSSTGTGGNGETTSGNGAGGGVSLGSSSSGSSTGSGGGFEACASSSQDAARIPVNMFITVDKSGSMADDNKWTHAKVAFQSFFKDPGAARLRVALRLFPRGECSAPACSVAACSEPDVDLGELSDPQQVEDLVNELASVSPSGTTPMSTALNGATKWATARAGEVGASEKVVVVLVSDGDPHGCNNDVVQIAGSAQKAYDAAGVLTFAIGLAGSNQQTMDQIAHAGQTEHGYFIGKDNTAAGLLAALQDIEIQSASCAYAMPTAVPGDVLDPTRVNVTVLPSGAATPASLDQVKGATACGSAGGWYYDDPSHPGSIQLCPGTCNEVKKDPDAKVQIVLGCATQVK
ncbi:Hypothetical protein A7982_00960 [Minicystis rosea]|nr:Hypothetical protein A7982_00960 [Minicystis rosea]